MAPPRSYPLETELTGGILRYMYGSSVDYVCGSGPDILAASDEPDEGDEPAEGMALH